MLGHQREAKAANLLRDVDVERMDESLSSHTEAMVRTADAAARRDDP